MYFLTIEGYRTCLLKLSAYFLCSYPLRDCVITHGIWTIQSFRTPSARSSIFTACLLDCSEAEVAILTFLGQSAPKGRKRGITFPVEVDRCTVCSTFCSTIPQLMKMWMEEEVGQKETGFLFAVIQQVFIVARWIIAADNPLVINIWIQQSLPASVLPPVYLLPKAFSLLTVSQTWDNTVCWMATSPGIKARLTCVLTWLHNMQRSHNNYL